MASDNFIFKQVDSPTRLGDTPRASDAPPRVVLHTTEMVSSSAAKMRNAFKSHSWPPHIWCSFSEVNSWAYGDPKWGSKERTTQIRKGYDEICQRIPLHRTSYALRHPKGTPETNHMGRYCIQIEIEGYALDTTNWPNSILYKLGDWVLAPIGLWIRQNGFPDFTFKPRLDMGKRAGGYGTKGSARMTAVEWLTGTKEETGTGWNLCAHQEVPDNTHWDAGGLNIRKIADRANESLIGSLPDPHVNLTAALDKIEQGLLEARKAIHSNKVFS